MYDTLDYLPTLRRDLVTLSHSCLFCVLVFTSHSIYGPKRRGRRASEVRVNTAFLSSVQGERLRNDAAGERNNAAD